MNGQFRLIFGDIPTKQSQIQYKLKFIIGNYFMKNFMYKTIKFVCKRKTLKITVIINKLYTVAVVENAYATKSSSIFRSRRQNEHILTQLCAHQSSFKIIIRSCIQFELSKNQSINYRKYS